MFIDENEFLHLSGRIKQSNLNIECTHPILLSSEGIITKLLGKRFHQPVGPDERGYTLNKIRSSLYWILQASSVVGFVITRCFRCRYLRGKVKEEKMADVPSDRISIEPSFTYAVIDMFSPFTVKQYRKEMKQYGIILTQCVLCTLKYCGTWKQTFSFRH